jgi:hypothetical protein
LENIVEDKGIIKGKLGRKKKNNDLWCEEYSCINGGE